MFTASHNPAEYNGVKLCLSGARPIGQDTGLAEIKGLARAGVDTPATSPGRVEQLDLLDEFAEHVRSFVDTSALTPLKVVADTANGMGGLVVPRVFATLPFELEVLYGELDGTFPNHPADPIQPENLRDLQARARDRRGRRPGLRRRRRPGVPGGRQGRAAVGLDHHRHRGQERPREGARRHHPPQPHLLEGRPRSSRRTGRAGPHPGRALVHQGGHGRDRRSSAGALGALLLRDNTGPTRCIAVDGARADLQGGRAAVVAAQAVDRYAASGEINTRVDDAQEVIERVAAAYPDAHQDRLDGLTVDNGDWWFNLRPSNTEPLLRLNLEAPTREACDRHVAEVRALITDKG